MMSSVAATAVVLVLIGAILRASRKVWIKRFQDAEHPQQWKTRPKALTAAQMYCASASFFIWAFATGGAHLKIDAITYTLWIAGAGVIAIFNMACRTQLQGLKGISFATPIEAMVPLGALILSPLFGKDFPVSRGAVGGITLMVLGFYLLDVKKAQLIAQREDRPFKFFTPITMLKENPALLAVVGVVILGSISVNLDARISRQASIPWSFAWIFLVSAVGNTVHAQLSGEFKDLKPRHLLTVALPGTLFGAGNGITNYGFRYTSTAAIAALKRIDGIFALIGSFVINREREGFWNRLLSLCCILAGAIILALSM